MKTIGGQSAFENTEFTPEEIALCNERYLECPLDVSYADWCKAYIALNSTEIVDGGVALDGNIVIDTMMKHARKKKKRFQIGSYKKKVK